MENIEKQQPHDENKDVLKHLAEKEAKDTPTKKPEMPKEFGSYKKLVQFAKENGDETKKMIATLSTLKDGTPEHELLQKQIAGNKEMLTEVLTKIALADRANEIALLHEGDPDFDNTLPTDYQRG